MKKQVIIMMMIIYCTNQNILITNIKLAGGENTDTFLGHHVMFITINKQFTGSRSVRT